MDPQTQGVIMGWLCAGVVIAMLCIWAAFMSVALDFTDRAKDFVVDWFLGAVALMIAAGAAYFFCHVRWA